MKIQNVNITPFKKNSTATSKQFVQYRIKYQKQLYMSPHLYFLKTMCVVPAHTSRDAI